MSRPGTEADRSNQHRAMDAFVAIDCAAVPGLPVRRVRPDGLRRQPRLPGHHPLLDGRDERIVSLYLTNAAGTAKTLESAVAALTDAPSSPAVVLGSFTFRERLGNEGTVDYFDDPLYSLNVRGIPSPSQEVWTRTVREVANRAHELGKQVWVSVAAFDPDGYAELTALVFRAGADAVELNFGCPNMQDGGTFAPILSYRPDMIVQALSGVLSVATGEIWAKVSPIFDDALFADLASVLIHAVTGVVAINTLPQCMAMGDGGLPCLSFGTGVGGMAGAALKPIALAQAARWVRFGFRTIGVGGIETARDLADYEAVGCESCQANTVVQREGFGAIERIMGGALGH
jgi:dihydroorotate dehydrogenase